jgi:aminoglycoside phosphotransferase (APT) family kinase protein
LGETHAALHDIDPVRLVKVLDKRGIDGYGYRLQSRFDWLSRKAERWPWLRQAVDWLLEHRPPEPKHLSVCHGDFHPFNLMFDKGKITGVLDWPGFAIADPAYDIGNTLVLVTITAKHLTGSMEAFSSVDWDLMATLYLAAYRAHRPLENAYLDYYRVRRCVMALVQGVEGQKIWQHPLIVRDLLVYILDVTGAQISMPAVGNP